MHDGEENITIGALMEGVYALFRSRDDYESVSETEHDLVARIQYASAVVQAEKVTPPGGWDPYGRSVVHKRAAAREGEDRRPGKGAASGHDARSPAPG